MHPSHFGHWRKIRIRRVCLVPDTCLIMGPHDVKCCCIWGWWQSLLCTTDTKQLDSCFVARINLGHAVHLADEFLCWCSNVFRWENPCQGQLDQCDVAWIRPRLFYCHVHWTERHYNIPLWHGVQVVCLLDQQVATSGFHELGNTLEHCTSQLSCRDVYIPFCHSVLEVEEARLCLAPPQLSFPCEHECSAKSAAYQLLRGWPSKRRLRDLGKMTWQWSLRRTPLLQLPLGAMLGCAQSDGLKVVKRDLLYFPQVPWS